MNGSNYLQSSVHIFLANYAIASLKSIVNVLASIPEGPATPFVSMAALFAISPVIFL